MIFVPLNFKKSRQASVDLLGEALKVLRRTLHRRVSRSRKKGLSRSSNCIITQLETEFNSYRHKIIP